MSENNTQYMVSFFYVFDLAEFFTKGKDSKGEDSIEFLDSRSDKEFHQLFSYKNEGKKNEPSDVKNLTNVGSFTYCKAEWEKEGKAYLAGLVRLNLLHQFFHPTYEFKVNNESKSHKENLLFCFCSLFECKKKAQSNASYTDIFGELLHINEEADKNSSLRNVKEIYKNGWYDVVTGNNSNNYINLLNNLKLYISISRYGTVSVRIEGDIPINPVGTLNGNEFVQAKEIVSKLLNCPKSESQSFRDKINKTVNKDLPRIPDYHPSLLDFIALITVWNFLSELKEKECSNVNHLKEWFETVGELKDFQDIWNKCFSGQFDISHELSYFYFQDSRYRGISAYPEHFIDNMCLLGRFVFSASEENEDIHFSPSVLEHVRQEELSITDNGSVHILAGASLIVTVDKQSYQLHGMTLNEKEFWDWMFRLLCCLRECYVLAGICSTDLRELSRNDEGSFKNIYSGNIILIISTILILFVFVFVFVFVFAAILISVPVGVSKVVPVASLIIPIIVLGIVIFIRWRNFNSLKNNVSKLSNLLFTIEESTNSITSSKMPAVQDKLQIFTERMGLNALIENLNKRRLNLETRISQYITEWIGIIGISVAFIALVIALLSLINDISPTKMKEECSAIKTNS